MPTGLSNWVGIIGRTRYSAARMRITITAPITILLLTRGDGGVATTDCCVGVRPASGGGGDIGFKDTGAPHFSQNLAIGEREVLHTAQTTMSLRGKRISPMIPTSSSICFSRGGVKASSQFGTLIR